MTQEDKELLLKDLCARLPYGFAVHRYCDNCDITFEKNELDGFSHFLEYSEGEEFKPYLRQMSSMTDDEQDELDNIRLGNYGEDVDWLNKNMFDYRGLIEKGLALEAPKDMYKNE